jgi:hypothetical protein
MRTYGRVPIDPLNPTGPKRWVVVETTPQGFNDDVYVTALAQTLLLNINESPFFAQFGIPAHQSVMQQIAPDFYVVFTQQYYSQFFASLTVAKLLEPEPHYRFSVITHQGFKYPDIRVRGAPI